MINLKKKLALNELTIGSWLSIPNMVVCEMMTMGGFEWLTIDMEHTSITDADMLHMIQIISLSGVVPLVRVGKNDPLLIKKAMDCGAHGVIVPMVNSSEDALIAVKSVYYPPKGQRGTGLFRAQGYGQKFSSYLSGYEKSTVVVVQIEHYLGVENIDEILAVDGVDAFIVGPYDLSASYGTPGNFDNEKVKDALEVLEKKMDEGSKPGGHHIIHTDKDILQKKICDGYKFIAYGDDMIFLSEQLVKVKKHLSY